LLFLRINLESRLLQKEKRKEYEIVCRRKYKKDVSHFTMIGEGCETFPYDRTRM
jgi:hypothetical protein